MAQKRALIVLDNVDNARDIEAFVMALGTSSCRLLITSRDGALATTLGVVKRCDVSLDVLPLEAALRQLADWTNNDVKMLPPVAHEVAAACGRLPFALSLCGAFAADGLSWADIAETLRQTDLDFLERRFPDYPYPSILRSLNASMEILERQDPLAARCFRQLAVFYKGDSVPEKAVTMLWMHSEKLDGRRVRKLLVQLERKSLLRVDGDEPFRRISLHDLQHDYLTQLVSDMLALHDTLLAAYRSQCGDTGEWLAGPDDDYFLQRVAYHLAAAEKLDDLRHLLFDVRWIERRLAATDPISTITDYNFLPDNPQAAALKDALRLSIPVLWRNPGQLRGQLAGRLPPGFLPGMLGPTDRLELRPVSASLARVGGPAVLSLEASASVNALVVHSDGKLLLSVAEGGWIEVWNILTGTRVASFTGSGLQPTCLAVAAEVGHVLCGFRDAPVEVWRLDSQTLAAKLAISDVTAIAVNPGGQRAIFGSSHRALGWDLAKNTGLGSLLLPTVAVGISPDGRHGVSVGYDSKMVVWDVETGERIRCTDLSGDNHYVMAAAVSEDAQWAVVACREKIAPWEEYPLYLHAGVWDVAGGRLKSMGPIHKDLITAVGVASHGDRCLSASKRADLVAWRPEAGGDETALGNTGSSVSAIAVAPDGSWAATSTGESRITVWDLERKEDREPVRHRKQVSSVAFAADSSRAVSVDGSSVALLWDPASGAAAAEWTGGSFLLCGIFLPPRGFRLVLAGAMGCSIDATTGNLVDPWNRSWKPGPLGLPGFDMDSPFLDTTVMTATPDGGLLIVGRLDGTILTLNAETGAIVSRSTVHRGAVLDIVVDRQGTMAVSSGHDGKVQVWTLADLGAARTLVTEQCEIDAIALLDDNRLVWSGPGGTVRVMKMQEVGSARAFDIHRETVTFLSPIWGQTAIVSGSADGSVRVWLLSDGTVVTEMTIDQPISCGAVAPDESTVAVGDISGGVHFLRFHRG